jgi:hypothetical protein
MTVKTVVVLCERCQAELVWMAVDDLDLLETDETGWRHRRSDPRRGRDHLAAPGSFSRT